MWKTASGETVRLAKGRYAILKRPDGKYREEYINPATGKHEDAVLAFGDLSEDEKGGVDVVDKVEIRSRKDFEALLQRIEELNK